MTKTNLFSSALLLSTLALAACVGPDGAEEPLDETAQALGVATKMQLGHLAAFAIMDGGALYGWGDNASGQLGDGSTIHRSSPGPLGLADVIDVAGSTSHACAVNGMGAVYCWGSNAHGKLGDGTKTQRLTPTAVQILADATAVATGAEHSCALRDSGGVYCWGQNDRQQLGNGTTLAESLTPMEVSGIDNAIAIAAGSHFTCALRATGKVSCWGHNAIGQLGDAGTQPRPTPTEVEGVTGAVEIALGANHGCARLGDNTVRCWGDNSAGQLGVGDAALSYKTWSLPVPGLSDIRALGAGAAHTCAVQRDGRALCWGDNAHMQLGNGTTDDQLSPTKVADLEGAVAIDGGASATCARLATGALQCWGDDTSGTLGDGGALPGSASASPLDVLLP